ncbi:MAG: hypothetical protein ABI594_08075 [Ginsengibacter sp.]
MILQFAKIPPPIGGISIHVKRLLDSLEKEPRIKAEVLDYSKEKNLFDILRKIFNSKIIHIHLSKKKHRLFMVCLFKVLFKKVIVTYHGKYDFENNLDILSLRLCDAAIVLNQFSYNHALKKLAKHNKIYQIGAFIPPQENSITPLIFTLKERIVLLKKKCEIIFSANASGYVLDSFGKEIYMGSELLNFFGDNKNLGLIFSDPSGAYANFFIENNIEVPGNVLIINESHDFVNVLKYSDALIRATTMDGDSLSVKEALYYGLPVFASDVVDRPDGVILFSELYELSNKLNALKNPLPKVLPENNYNAILKLYKSILKN